MDEKKRTLGEFIKENKGKIIKRTLIVVGVTAGVVLVVKTIKSGAALNKEGLEIIDQIGDGLTQGVEVIGEAVTNV